MSKTVRKLNDVIILAHQVCGVEDNNITMQSLQNRFIDDYIDMVDSEDKLEARLMDTGSAYSIIRDGNGVKAKAYFSNNYIGYVTRDGFGECSINILDNSVVGYRANYGIDRIKVTRSVLEPISNDTYCHTNFTNTYSVPRYSMEDKDFLSLFNSNPEMTAKFQEVMADKNMTFKNGSIYSKKVKGADDIFNTVNDGSSIFVSASFDETLKASYSMYVGPSQINQDCDNLSSFTSNFGIDHQRLMGGECLETIDMIESELDFAHRVNQQENVM